MSLCRWFVIQGLMVCLWIAPAARSQQPAPHIGYVYPAGGRQGATFQITVGGQFLEGVSDVDVSGSGVEAAVLEYTRPLTPQQFNQFRDKLKELLERKSAADKDTGKGKPRTTTKPVWTADDEKMLAEVRKKLANPPKRQGNPAIAETVTLRVTVASNAEPGERELRLAVPAGLTNPVVFCVGQLPEFSEKESSSSNELPVNKPPKAAKLPRPGLEPRAKKPDTEMTLTLPAVVNGQIMPGEVDRCRFRARRGQRLVVAVAGRALIPYLPDAVPGWFQPTLTIYDAKGKELAYDDDYRFHPDPVLFFQIPKDGEYVIEIKDAIYRGREDFVYRITVGELPFITSIFPLGGRAGEQTTVALRGWNLPVDSFVMDAKDKGAGVCPLSVRKGDLVSNVVPFAADTLPECVEKEPNNRPHDAQPVTLPLIVNGRIDQPGDRDVFRFEGRAGENVVAEVYARRLDSPLDSTLTLTDAAGRQLAFNDDHEDKGAGLTTHHADSWLRATLPADGAYCIHVGDAQNKGGPEYAYRLRISPPRPDFELRIVPSSINIRAGATVPLTVHALRKDGFSGDIALSLKDSPAGFTLGGARIPGNQDQVRLTLTAAPTRARESLPLSFEGRAKIQGQEVVRPVVPAEDMMQAFAYRHLVPSRKLMLAVLGRGMQKNAVRILTGTPVKIPVGGTARVRVGLPGETPAGKVQLELSEAPDGITIRSISTSRDSTEIVLESDAKKVKPGLKGNLIVSAFVEKAPAPTSSKAQTNKRRMPISTLPAVPFEVVAK